MSGEENPELTKSWVLVDSVKKFAEDKSPTSGLEEVTENDTDTDSISVISESGCSYKTDDDEFVPATAIPEDKDENKVTEVETPETVQAKISVDENPIAEKLLYFATSAVCAIILIGFSVAIQQYFNNSSHINTFNANQQQDFSSGISRHAQEQGHVKTSNSKRNIQEKFDDTQKKIKIDSEKITIGNNDLKSNYKANKNKNLVGKLENKGDKKSKYSDHNDKIYNEKLNELKIKEIYLKNKEKFLIEKEHKLLKKELELHKEKHGDEKYKYKEDKKKDSDKCDKSDDEKCAREIKNKKHKYTKHDDIKEKLSKYNSDEKTEKSKFHNKYSKKNSDLKSNNKYRTKKEIYRQYSAHDKIDDEQLKKRNVSGQWYMNLHKARKHLRQKEHSSDWVFDRAHHRRLKRNKAHWYFQWMVDRARLRAK